MYLVNIYWVAGTVPAYIYNSSREVVTEVFLIARHHQATYHTD